MSGRLQSIFAVIATAFGLIAALATPVGSQGVPRYPDTAANSYYTVPVATLAEAGIFVGTECTEGFCPDRPIKRSTVAVWIVRVIDGVDPAAVTSTRFTDVEASHPHAAFVERLAELEITTGCGDGSVFCPDSTVTRAQMATFLSRAYELPESPDAGFTDVPRGTWYTAAVDNLAASGITKGCGVSLFCPEHPTTRGQMATFLHRAEQQRHKMCRPAGPTNFGLGFPLWAGAAPSSGRVKLTVLFMDFDDAQATYTTHQEIEHGLSYMEHYLEAQSYGRLDLDIEVVHRWWRSSLGYKDYTDKDAGGFSALYPSAGAESVRLADDSYDFSDTDVVLTVFPSTHFGGGSAIGSATADGKELSTFRVNTHRGRVLGHPSNWGLIAAHELVHNFGLPDLYPFNQDVHRLPDPPPGTQWVSRVEFGLMGLRAYFPTTDRSIWDVAIVEMLAWSRWQLGWLKPSQVQCGISTGQTVVIEPVAEPEDGTVMAVVPLNDHELIVVENRRWLGYDASTPDASAWGAAPSKGLLEEGVLVYTIDTRLGNGDLPIRIAGDTGNAQFSGFPVLGLGESITVRGYTITVVDDHDDTYEVVIEASS